MLRTLKMSTIMKAKALIAAALLAMGATTATAQSAGQFRLGVTAGMNVTNITDQNTDSRIGFNVGLRGEYNFTNNWYGTLGLLFSQKGTRTEEEGGAMGVKAKGTFIQNPGYIELPLHFGGRYSFGNGVSIFGETGPYFAFGVCGKNKFNVDTNVGINKDYDTKFFDSNEGDAQVFDFGWGLRAGVEVSKFQISLGYDHGITKVWDVDDLDARNSNFTVNVAYMF